MIYSNTHLALIQMLSVSTCCSLQLDVDDTEMVNKRTDGRRRIVTTSPLYFGGVPPGYAIVSSNVAAERTFVGCIGDVTVNGE